MTKQTEWFERRGKSVSKGNQVAYVFKNRENLQLGIYIARHIKEAKLWVLEHETDIHETD